MATSSSGRAHARVVEADSTDLGTRRLHAADDDPGMMTPPPAEDPTIAAAEQLLRRLGECTTAEQAELLIVQELPALVGADWAAVQRPDARPAGSSPPHRRLAAAALSAGCVFSMGEPPTVAAVPFAGTHGDGAVILIGRDAGLCRPQLRLVALFAEHAGALLPTVRLAATA